MSLTQSTPARLMVLLALTAALFVAALVIGKASAPAASSGGVPSPLHSSGAAVTSITPPAAASALPALAHPKVAASPVSASPASTTPAAPAPAQSAPAQSAPAQSAPAQSAPAHSPPSGSKSGGGKSNSGGGGGVIISG